MTEHHEIIVDILGAVPDWCEGEIVRCGDCIWFIDDPDMYTSSPFCDYLDGIHFKPDDFCSYGQRKDGTE